MLTGQVLAGNNKMKERYDMVMVSRSFGEAKSEDDDFVTGFANWMFTRPVNVLSRGHCVFLFQFTRELFV